MTATDGLELGRELFRQQAWGEAHARLAAADRDRPLDPDDLERLATAAHLLGRDEESADAAGPGSLYHLDREPGERRVSVKRGPYDRRA
jgi:uncharacterized protein HemY